MKEKRVKIKQNRTKSKPIYFPSKIFKDRSLSVLEALSEHLKDSQNLTYHEIAVLLNRDDRTIWTAYHRAKKKRGIIN